jgi:hypothetical protein
MSEANRLERQHWLKNAGYRYSGFISWPRRPIGTDNTKVRRLVEKLQKGVQDVAPLHGLPPAVFLDSEAIDPGEDWHRRIATAICGTISFIAVCGPEYYESIFCGREWAGMEQLSLRRLAGQRIAILPLVWQPARSQGATGLLQDEAMPPQVSRLQHRDFSRLRLHRPDVEETDEFNDFVQEIVSRIDHAATALLDQGAHAEDCDHFEIPAESAFRDFTQAAQRYPLTREK